jgi:hypothetical protein
VSHSINHRRSTNFFTAFSDRLLGPGGSREDAFEIANNLLLLVEAKCQSLEQSLIACIPEAVSQAIALLKSIQCVSTACFTLSSEHGIPAFQRSVSVYPMGKHDFSSSLKLENDTLTYYESAIRRMSRDIVEDSELPLREILMLVCEWVSFSIGILLKSNINVNFFR